MISTKSHEDECTPAISVAFKYLAEAVSRPRDPETLIVEILELVATVVDAGAVILLRREDSGDIVARVDHCYDRAGIGVRRDDHVRLHDTYAASTVEEAHARVDGDIYGNSGYFEMMSARHSATGTYTGVPIYRPNSRRFGTLCILHSSARPMLAGETALLGLAGRIIADAAGPDAASRALHPARQRVARARTAGWRTRYLDITAHQQANDTLGAGENLSRILEALRASEERFRVTFEQAAAGIAHVGLDGYCLLLNGRLCDIVGQTREQLLGRQFHSVVDTAPAHRHRLLDIDQIEGQRLLRGEIETYTKEKRYIRKDGTEVWLDVTVSLARAPGGAPAYFICVLQDVTQRQLAEEALRDLRATERRRIARDMHDGVLQDLTYALHGLRTTQRRVGDADVADELCHDADILERSVQGLRDAIYNLRFDGAKGYSFVELVEYLVGLSRRLTTHQEVRLVLPDGFPAGIPVVIGIELSRILREALFNAQRHADARHVVVTIGVDDHELWMEVADDGRGFDVDTTVGGVGLDSMCERARLLGGVVRIASTIGTGTCVAFRAPRAALWGGDVVY